MLSPAAPFSTLAACAAEDRRWVMLLPPALVRHSTALVSSLRVSCPPRRQPRAGRGGVSENDSLVGLKRNPSASATILLFHLFHPLYSQPFQIFCGASFQTFRKSLRPSFILARGPSNEQITTVHDSDGPHVTIDRLDSRFAPRPQPKVCPGHNAVPCATGIAQVIYKAIVTALIVQHPLGKTKLEPENHEHRHRWSA